MSKRMKVNLIAIMFILAAGANMSFANSLRTGPTALNASCHSGSASCSCDAGQGCWYGGGACECGPE